MNEYDFAERLAFSHGRRAGVDTHTLKDLIPGCVEVRKNDVTKNDRGVDFIATLRGGAELNIDHKARDVGCSRYWRYVQPELALGFGEGTSPQSMTGGREPELSLETWSVCPEHGGSGVAGWTLDESKLTDYTYHTFDLSDSDEVFLLPFQLLRMAFRNNHKTWCEAFRVERQVTPSEKGRNGWTSECVFVPAWCVVDAIKSEMRRQR